MRIRRPRRSTPLTSPHDKPLLVTIHAAGDQHHTFAMGPGDAVGVGAIRVDIDDDLHIHATPIEPVGQ